MLTMKIICLCAAMSLIALGASTGSAASLLSGSAIGEAASPFRNPTVQKVHGRHCKRQWSKKRGWHRHRQACGRPSNDAQGFIPGHVLTPYGYSDCIGWWERHPDGRMQCHGQYIRDK
jgi:hypothetical protein